MIRCEIEESDTMKIDSSTDLELVLIGQSWNAPHCESGHSAPKNRECTHVPVAALTVICDGVYGMKVCEGVVRYTNSRFTLGVLCSGCYLPASECWSLTPLPAS